MARPRGGGDRARLSTEDVYQHVRTLILENTIAPGERVNIDALARELRVSQTPVREAMKRLEGDHLVVSSPGKGYRTSPLIGLERLRELFEFRLLVDVWAARSVAVNRLANPAPVLQREIESFEHAIAGAEDVRRQLVVHDTRFHGAILSALQNDVVRGAYEQTHSHLHTFRLYPADTEGTITLAEHRRIWAAIDSCDADQAEAAMREHLTAAFFRFAAAFDQPAGELRQPSPHRMY